MIFGRKYIKNRIKQAFHSTDASFALLTWGKVILRDQYPCGQMAANSCNTFSNAFSWVEIVEFCLKFEFVPEGPIHNKSHDDVIKWKHFLRCWPFVREIHRSPVNSPHKGQWRGALMFSLICVWINNWVNNREAGDLRRYRAYYDVSVMKTGSGNGLGDCSAPKPLPHPDSSTETHLKISYHRYHLRTCKWVHIE